MVPRVVLLTALAGLLSFTQISSAQFSRSGLLDPQTARRYGLQREWFAQIDVDRGSGRVMHTVLHVSSTQSHTVFEVTYDGGRTTFSERDADLLGQPLGKDGAKAAAEKRVNELEQAQRNPKLVTHVVPQITLYATTDRAVVHAIDAETGRTRWTASIGNPDYPNLEPAASDQYVAVINGSTLYVLDSKTGSEIWRRRADGVPGAGPGVGEQNVFVPAVSGAMEAYRLKEPQRPPIYFQSHGRILLPPTVTPNSVVWATDRGHLNVAEASELDIRFRLEANDTITSPAVYQAPFKLYTTSIDGYVYGIHEMNGSLLWRFSTGEPISQSPMPVGDAVYAVTDTGILFRLSAELGEEHWTAQGIRQLIAVSGNRVYCLNTMRRLEILDANSGSRVGTIPTESLDLVITNPKTDRIYIGSRSGRLQCLRQRELEWPLVHVSLEEPKPQQEQVTPEQPAPARPEPERPMPTDPFGNDPFGGGADPFGLPPNNGGGNNGGADGNDGDADPFGAGADPFGAGADPFGSP